MSRHTAADGTFLPFTRGDLAELTGCSASTIKNFQVRGLLHRRASGGPGKSNGFTDEDVVRTWLAKQLIKCGLMVSSIHSVFQSIQEPVAPSAKSWGWLESDEARREGAVLVLIVEHDTGFACLTTVALAQRLQGDQRTKIAINLSRFINELEARTGRRFALSTTTTAQPGS